MLRHAVAFVIGAEDRIYGDTLTVGGVTNRAQAQRSTMPVTPEHSQSSLCSHSLIWASPTPTDAWASSTAGLVFP